MVLDECEGQLHGGGVSCWYCCLSRLRGGAQPQPKVIPMPPRKRRRRRRKVLLLLPDTKVESHSSRDCYRQRSCSITKFNLPCTLLGYILLALVLNVTLASEYPERECCDPVYPIPAPGGPGYSQSANIGHGAAIAPAAAYPEFVPPTHSSIGTGVTTDVPTGGQMKTATAIMNCIQARNFCVDNSACSPILEIVPRVCGTEKVACTTTTVTKCVAALRTLKAFPYFYPTCLCREPSSDPTCNAFRDYLFDHPCTTVEKEKDPYPVHTLPYCDYALDVCRKEHKCIQHYRDFKSNCRVSDGNCKMEDWDSCHESWTKLRLTPMFGCICPSGHPKCDRIYGEVNYNPCVDLPQFDLSGTNSAIYLHEHQHQHRRRGGGMVLTHLYSFPPASIFPNPGTAHHRHQHQQRQPNTIHQGLDPNVVIVPAARTESHLFVDESFSTPISYRGYPSPGSYSTSQSGSITVQVISSSHAPDHEIESQLETPLLGSAEAHAEQRSKPPLFTFNPPPVLVPPKHAKSGGGSTTERGDRDDGGSRTHSSSSSATRFSDRGIATISSINRHQGGSGGGGGNEKSLNQVVRVPLHSTCYTALQNCHRSPACSKLLQNVIYWCDLSRCRQETCMQALQNFYRGVQERWAMEVAFCLCRKSDARQDQECLHAQAQLHPVCAQRGDLGISPPSCHSLAVQCRSQPDCRTRLEIYEKACAVDSVTRKCAGPTAQCRNATIGILGTVLKKSCACNGTDYTQLYDCLGWQRILWVNPCVVEAQRDYHRIKALASGGGTSTPRLTTTIGNPTEYSHEGILMGTDVASTTLGHAIQPAVVSRPEFIPQERITTTFHSRNPSSSSSSSSSSTSNSGPSSNSGNSNSHSTHHNHGQGVSNHGNHHQHSNSKSHSYSGSNNNNQHHNSQWIGHTSSPPGSGSSGSSTSTRTSIHHQHRPSTEEVTTLKTPSTSTQRTTSTSTQPQNYCPVRRPNQPDQLIMEGQSRRLYREDRRSCSELCTCPFDNLQALCTVLTCLDVTTCDYKQRDNKTVFYKHEEPMYLAGRGQCMCYGGHFICKRPNRERYTLHPGVFLFLGFSNQDEAVLKDHTGLDALNVIDELRKLIDPYFQYQFVNPAEKDHGLDVFRKLNTSECRLSLFKKEDENLIIHAAVPREDFGANFTIREPKPDDEHLIKEKEKCSAIFKELSDLINSRGAVIQSHPLLSILKLAEAHEDKIPKSSAGYKAVPFTIQVVVMVTLFFQLCSSSLMFDMSNYSYNFSTGEQTTCNPRHSGDQNQQKEVHVYSRKNRRCHTKMKVKATSSCYSPSTTKTAFSSSSLTIPSSSPVPVCL